MGLCCFQFEPIRLELACIPEWRGWQGFLKPAPPGYGRSVVQEHSRAELRAMTNIACQLEYSVEAEVSSAFAWKWRTDIKNWDDPPAQFQLHGPFESGSWGTTLIPAQSPLAWQIRDVRPGVGFTIEAPLQGAMLRFEWVFGAVSAHRTRITQRITLMGDNAAAYVTQVQSGLGSNLALGMNRIAELMVQAESE